MTRKTFITRSGNFVLLFSLVIVFYMMQCRIISLAEDTLPNGIAFRSSNGIGLTFQEVQTASEIKDTELSGVSLKKAMVSSELSIESTYINLVLTDANYHELVPLHMISGNYFEVSAIPEENRFIVISDELAMKYFKSYDAVGFNLQVDNLEYTICGVYKSNRSLLNRLSSNGLDSVFMPYSGVLDYKNLPVNFVYASTDSLFSQSITDGIQKSTGKSIYPDSISNYTDTLALIKQSKSITIFLCALVISITLFVLLIKQSANTYKAYRKEESKNAIIKNAIKSAIYLIAMVVLCWLIKFKLYLPAGILPVDNIFDIKFYTDTIVSCIQKSNDLLLYDFHWNFAFRSMSYATLVAVCLFLSFIVTYAYALKSIKWWKLSRLEER